MDWRPIPSLSALRAFEAASRLENYSAAARELNVTHAAISQHVRSLESHFEQGLILRQGQKMALTPAGQTLANALSDGFGTIASGVTTLLQDAETKPLDISLTPAFAENWLMPRLGGFWAKHPNVQVTLRPSPALVDLKRDHIDLAIRFGDGNWPGLCVTWLTSAHYIIVAAPQLLAGRQPKSPEDLSDLPWVFESSYQEQSRLASEMGISVCRDNFNDMATTGLVLAAARAGTGVAILAAAIAERDIAEGSLIKLFEHRSNDLGYYLVTANNTPSKKLALFLDWLTSEGESKA